MKGTFLRVALKAESLSDIHVAIAESEEKGWKKAGGLLYVYEDGEQGWEIAMEKPISIDEPDNYVGIDTDSGSVLGVVAGIAVGCLIGAVAIGVARYFW